MRTAGHEKDDSPKSNRIVKKVKLSAKFGHQPTIEHFFSVQSDHMDKSPVRSKKNPEKVSSDVGKNRINCNNPNKSISHCY